MNTTIRRLLPCPVCGNAPQFVERAGLVAVMCGTCGGETWIHESRAFARAAWNRRVAASAVTPGPQGVTKSREGRKTFWGNQNAPQQADGGKARGLSLP